MLNPLLTGSRIGFGGSHLSLPDIIEQPALDAILSALPQCGIKFIDTADCYGWRLCDAHIIEQRMAARLRNINLSDKVSIGTKGGFTHHEGTWILNGHPNYLFAAINRSFLALGGQRPLPLWQLHAVDPAYPISMSLSAAVRAQAAGLIQHVGVCNVNNHQLREALDTLDLASVQNQSSAWFIEPDEQAVLETCTTHALTFFAHTPFGGRHAWRLIHHSPLLKRIAVEHHTSLYSILIAWLLSKAACVVPLVGTSNPAHLLANTDGCSIALADDEVAALNNLFEQTRHTLRKTQERNDRGMKSE